MAPFIVLVTLLALLSILSHFQIPVLRLVGGHRCALRSRACSC